MILRWAFSSIPYPYLLIFIDNLFDFEANFWLHPQQFVRFTAEDIHDILSASLHPFNGDGNESEYEFLDSVVGFQPVEHL